MKVVEVCSPEYTCPEVGTGWICVVVVVQDCCRGSNANPIIVSYSAAKVLALIPWCISVSSARSRLELGL